MTERRVWARRCDDREGRLRRALEALRAIYVTSREEHVIELAREGLRG